MEKVISNTSPILYLYRIGMLDLLPGLFSEILMPGAVVLELEEGQQRGFDVPDHKNINWLKIVDPRFTPSEWLAIDLGPGELATMSLALENLHYIVILDDALARKTAQAAGIKVWGTLKILLEAKSQGLIDNIGSLLYQLEQAGMWLSDDIRQRVLILGGEGTVA